MGLSQKKRKQHFRKKLMQSDFLINLEAYWTCSQFCLRIKTYYASLTAENSPIHLFVELFEIEAQ